jgi:hypothetical protein
MITQFYQSRFAAEFVVSIAQTITMLLAQWHILLVISSLDIIMFNLTLIWDFISYDG